MADGSLRSIEQLEPGDVVASIDLPGLARDADYRAQYDWSSTGNVTNAGSRAAAIARVVHGKHDGFYLINARIKATFEHPFLVRRGDETGFCSTELLRVGDRLIREDLSEERVESVERIDGRVATVSLYVPGTNTHLADGVWVHNDLAAGTGSSGGGPVSSASGIESIGSSSSVESGSSSKSSGSSFGGSSGSSSSSSGSSVAQNATASDGSDSIEPAQPIGPAGSTSNPSSSGSSVVDLLASFEGGRGGRGG
jgi:hypothetical protein